MPDGSKIKINNLQNAGEMLITGDGGSNVGIIQGIENAIMKCDESIRKEISEHIVIAGLLDHAFFLF